MKRLRVPRHRQPLLLRGFRANVQGRTFPVTPFIEHLARPRRFSQSFFTSLEWIEASSDPKLTALWTKLKRDFNRYANRNRLPIRTKCGFEFPSLYGIYRLPGKARTCSFCDFDLMGCPVYAH
jgi:hypothetical protein